MSSTGQRIESWMEAINEVFGHTLMGRPLPVIERMQVEYSYFGTITLQNGKVKKADIKFLIEDRRTKTFPVQLFCPTRRASWFCFEKCTYPGCIITKHNWFHNFRCWLTSTTLATNNKRYICLKHMLKVKAHLQRLCRSNGVEVNCSENVSDYINFMELCKMLQRATNCSARALGEITQGNPENARAVRELLINVRNYLVLVDLLIDVHGYLLPTMLPFIMDVTVLTLKTATINFPIQEFIEIVESLIQETLYFFGVIYHWEPLNNTVNPFSQAGLGMGGMVGVLNTLSGNILGGAVCMAVLGGIGYLVGNAYYNNVRTKQLMEQSLKNYEAFRHVHQESPRYTATTVVIVLLSILIAIQAMHIAMSLM